MKAIFSIVGMRFHEGATEMIRKLKAGDALTLTREPTNAFDPLAIQVFARGCLLGHIKANDAQIALAKRMDEDETKSIDGRYVANDWPHVEIDDGNEPELF